MAREFRRALGFLLAVAAVSLVAACAARGGGGGPQADPVQAAKHYREALRQVEAGRIDAALASIDSSIAYKSGFANSYKLRGWLWERLDRPDSAIVAYEKALRYRSAFPEVWRSLGYLNLSVGRYEAAIAYLRRTIQAMPDSAGLHLGLAEAAYRLQRYPLAFDHLRNYRRGAINPGPDYYKWLGLTHLATEAYPAAIDALTRYVERRPDDSAGHKYLGIARFESGDLDGGMSALNRAAALNRDDPGIYVVRSRYFFRVGKAETGWEQLEHARTLDDGDPEVLFELGWRHFETDQTDDARRYLTRVVERDSTFWRAYRYLGMVAERDGDLKRARELYTLYLNNTFREDRDVQDRLERIQAGAQKQ